MNKAEDRISGLKEKLDELDNINKDRDKKLNMGKGHPRNMGYP